MCSALDASTTMFGSLFGNGSSQSSFVFAPPEVAVHSVAQLCFAPGAIERANGTFSGPSPPGGSARTPAARNSPTPASDTSSMANRAFFISPPLSRSSSWLNVQEHPPDVQEGAVCAVFSRVGSCLLAVKPSWSNLSELDLLFKRSRRQAAARRREPRKPSVLGRR